jgi:hypothetical protein
MHFTPIDIRGIRFLCASGALVVGLAAALAPGALRQDPKNPKPTETRPAADRPPQKIASEAETAEMRSQFDRAMAEQGVAIDRERKLVSVRGRFSSPKQPLEYLVTAPHGSHYESLISVDVRPSNVAAALFSLGLTEGNGPTRKLKSPRPTDEELASGATIYEVVPGSGDRVYLYVEWTDDHGYHRHRIEDLVFERPEGRTIPNLGFVFVNSTMLEPRSKREVPAYAANVDGNLVSCGFASQPVLAFPKPHPYAMEGDFEIYQPNWTLIPSDPLPVVLSFSKDPLERPLNSAMTPESQPAPSRPSNR